MITSLRLKNTTQQGLADPGDYGSADLLATITGSPSAQATFRHTGTAGFWYITFRYNSNLSTTDYSIKLGPGETWSEDDPPLGDIYLLADGDVDGDLSWYIGRTT